MGLVGSLEDLGLGDILQIVSLARKSGVLNLSCGEVKGKIIFRDGLVVSALSSEIKKNLGLLLVQEGIITQQQLEQVLDEAKKRQDPNFLVKDFLSQQFGISREKIDEVIKKQVEEVVFSFFEWPEGNFSFELMEVEDEIRSLKNPWRQFVLDQGISPQYLAMEGTRLQDERKRKEAEPTVGVLPGEEEFEIKDEEFKIEPGAEEDFSSVAEFLEHYEKQQAERAKKEAEASALSEQTSSQLAEQSVISEGATSQKVALSEQEAVELRKESLEEQKPEAIPQQRAVIVAVDDEPLLLKAISDHFRPMGFWVETYPDAESAEKRINELIEQGLMPIIVADLIMPAGAGKTLLGGLELLKKVRSYNVHLPFILCTDYENQPAQKQAEKLNADYFFFKPKSSQIDETLSSPELRNFIQVLENAVQTLEKTLPQPAPEEKAEKEEELFDLAEELRKELGEEDFIIPEPPEEKSRGLDILRNMIQELNDPSSNGQITLLVLRFAAELMNRAVIFVVGKDYVAGLGQFGIQLDGKDPEKQVRKMRIPLNEPSIFQEVIEKRIPLKKKLKPTKWNKYLIENLGGVEPKEVFVAPIISSGKVAAILYGDNVPEDKEIGDTESLEIFLIQAGLVMEKALLERKLKEMGKPSTSEEKAS